MTPTNSQALRPPSASPQELAERRLGYCLQRMRHIDEDLQAVPGVMVRAYGLEGCVEWAEAHDAAVKAAWALTSRLKALQAAVEQRAARGEVRHDA